MGVRVCPWKAAESWRTCTHSVSKIVPVHRLEWGVAPSMDKRPTDPSASWLGRQKGDRSVPVAGVAGVWHWPETPHTCVSPVLGWTGTQHQGRVITPTLSEGHQAGSSSRAGAWASLEPCSLCSRWRR